MEVLRRTELGDHVHRIAEGDDREVDAAGGKAVAANIGRELLQTRVQRGQRNAIHRPRHIEHQHAGAARFGVVGELDQIEPARRDIVAERHLCIIIHHCATFHTESRCQSGSE